MKKIFVASVAIFLFVAQTASASVGYGQQVTLAPGWNIVSTPRLLDSHSFSAPETLANFAIYTLDPTRTSGWATMSELGQTEFTPLYGYFINNKATTTQTLTFNYKASTTPNERLFERKFTKEGWYSFGVANPSYAKAQGDNTTDTNNPDHILNSLLGVTSNYDSVVDFTAASFVLTPDSATLSDPWKLAVRSADVANTTEINSLNDFRETKGYAIYIKASSTLTGFQNAAAPQCADGIDNDGDGKIDFPTDPGCSSANDNDESNAPAGTFTLAKYSAYTNQTITAPQTAYKIGEYRLTTGATDSFTLSGIGLVLSGSSITPGSLSNVYLVVGGITSTVYSTATDTLLWSANTLLPANTTLSIAVYASLPSSLHGGDTVLTNLIVGGASQNTGDVVVTDGVNGQTITIGTSRLTGAVDASTPVSALVVGGTMPKVGSFKFISQNDAFTITELTASTVDSSSISELVFKDGATELGRQSFNGNYATKTGLSIPVSVNGTKVVDIYANLGNVGTNAGNAGGNVGIALIAMKYNNSSGVQTATTSVSGSGVAGTTLMGNNMYVYKTKPTITNVALPTSVLSAGTQTIYKFTITADAGGTVAWRKILFNISTSSSPGVFSVSNVTLYDASNESVPLANAICSYLGGSIITCTGTQDQEVSGSKTYVIKALVTGTINTGASVSTNITSSGLGFTAPTNAVTVQTTNSTFVWSDESVTPHTAITADWNNDNLIKNLPTDNETLTK